MDLTNLTQWTIFITCIIVLLICYARMLQDSVCIMSETFLSLKMVLMVLRLLLFQNVGMKLFSNYEVDVFYGDFYIVSLSWVLVKSSFSATWVDKLQQVSC